MTDGKIELEMRFKDLARLLGMFHPRPTLWQRIKRLFRIKPRPFRHVWRG